MRIFGKKTKAMKKGTFIGDCLLFKSEQRSHFVIGIVTWIQIFMIIRAILIIINK